MESKVFFFRTAGISIDQCFPPLLETPPPFRTFEKSAKNHLVIIIFKINNRLDVSANSKKNSSSTV